MVHRYAPNVVLSIPSKPVASIMKMTASHLRVMLFPARPDLQKPTEPPDPSVPPNTPPFSLVIILGSIHVVLQCQHTCSCGPSNHLYTAASPSFSPEKSLDAFWPFW
ncbi:unnamed protein product [Arabis nemorensis]|uniref:Uncharacterized protein n=1 Tax=Arabis nemorensis TaxID=586526 RepID=A0A565ARM9_9BRAS|nr:unnamed protein product [Arabis nemorensis]